MLVPDTEWIHAPWLVFDARRVLAPVLRFSSAVHTDAYSIPSIAVELGVRVRYLRDDSLEWLGQCSPGARSTVITLNDAVECTPWDMPDLTHEIGHAVCGEAAFDCEGKMQRRSERDAWLRGIYVAISRPLVEAIDAGSITVTDVASRCTVPASMVRVRLGLAMALGEIEGGITEGHELAQGQLLQLEAWMQDGRDRRFQDWMTA